jgi:hypothetical protein
MPAQTPARTTRNPLYGPSLLFLGLTGVSAIILFAQAVLGNTSLLVLSSPVQWLTSLDITAAFDTLSSAAEVVAAVLAIAVTVVAIVVELAATRFSHQITGLFLREPVNLAVLGVFIVTAVQCVWVAAVLEESGPGALLPQAGFAVTLGLVTLCLLLLIPYIYFVFTFLSPISVIDRICQDAYRHVVKTRPAILRRSQHRVGEAIDELQDVARSAIQQGDRSIAIAAINAMARFVEDYAKVRGELPEGWFDMSGGVAEDPDFIALERVSIDEIQVRQIWVERKILRRYLSLMSQAALKERDVANLIGISTRRMAMQLGSANPALLELCIYAFNSYLRATINVRDLRTAYYLMNQFRLIGEWLLEEQQDARAVEIADYLRDYGQFAHNMGASFLLESAAYYVMRMVECAVEHRPSAVDALLECLLNLDMEIKEESQEAQEASLLGVRRAQMQVATLFLLRGDDRRARLVAEDLRGERIERLERLRRTMLDDQREQFWELADFGVNFSYLQPERREYLEPLFDLIRRTN